MPVHDTVNRHVTGKATDAAATGIMTRKKTLEGWIHDGKAAQFTLQTEEWCQVSVVKFQ